MKMFQKQLDPEMEELWDQVEDLCDEWEADKR